VYPFWISDWRLWIWKEEGYLVIVQMTDLAAGIFLVLDFLGRLGELPEV